MTSKNGTVAKALPGNIAEFSNAVHHGGKMAPSTASSALNALYDEKGSWRAVADEVGDVSPALCWKVANGQARSPKMDKALGIPTQRRCKANGWIRRAVWLHRDDLARFDAWLQGQGCDSLQELVDEMIDKDGG